ncbi:MAG: pilus assembly protein CpaE [Micropruina sp.]|nr:MAG: pilus assembly protein CpaE [Micropruina sp.]
MISRDLAERLRAAGVDWHPQPGDRFMIPAADLADDVFVISDMTIETQRVPGGFIIKFNGTTEWALDSIDAAKVIWLPREDQLRALVGPRFVRLEAIDGGFAVVLDDGRRLVDLDPERAYARAALAVRDEPA